MVSVLANLTYRRLFLAQVVALLGTGLATVALALLAYDLAGEAAGQVLGTALAIKMIAYVGVSPVAAAFAERLPRRGVLVALDLVRGGVALFLPFVTEIWQIYVLIFLLQSASAGFTPTFQATIPDILEDEDDYTSALSLSRLAYDLENLLSPMLAAALLSVIGFHWLFFGTVIGFAASAALVLSVRLPARAAERSRPFAERVTRGVRLYLATPRLRGLMAINLAVAAAGAMVIVNTVVYVQGVFDLGERRTALAMAVFGGGSMLVAISLPSLLRHISDRAAMLTGAATLAVVTALSAAMTSYSHLLALWLLLGLGYSLAQSPSGRLLKRSAAPEDRPALFAAQFALSHACWLIAYPLAGWLGAGAGLSPTALALAGIAGVAFVAALRLWPAQSENAVEHAHPDLPLDHPHLSVGERLGPQRHRHKPHIDDLHGVWPRAN